MSSACHSVGAHRVGCRCGPAGRQRRPVGRQSGRGTREERYGGRQRRPRGGGRPGGECGAGRSAAGRLQPLPLPPDRAERL